MHLHGHWFWVMARGQLGDGTWNSTGGSVPLNEAPSLRDTVTLSGKSYAVLRFVANNPGIWIFHCERAGAAGGGLLALLPGGRVEGAACAAAAWAGGGHCLPSAASCLGRVGQQWHTAGAHLPAPACD